MSLAPMTETPSIADVVAEGRKAFRDGVGIRRNPWRGPAFYWWKKGWLQANAEKAVPPPPPEPVPVEEPFTSAKRHVALIQQFERAVTEHEWIGTIPVFCEDADEQRRADAERRRLTSNLTKTRNNLLRELAREPKFSLKD